IPQLRRRLAGPAAARLSRALPAPAMVGGRIRAVQQRAPPTRAARRRAALKLQARRTADRQATRRASSKLNSMQSFTPKASTTEISIRTENETSSLGLTGTPVLATLKSGPSGS